jgi:hypothetical protein
MRGAALFESIVPVSLRTRVRESIVRRTWRRWESRLPPRDSAEHGVRWCEEREKLYERYGCLRCPKPDIARLAELRGRHAGKRIFIMGNGPSLNRTPLEKLKDEFTFGVNRVHLLFDRIDWRPTFYTVVDWRVGGDCAREINALSGMIFFFPERFRGLLREGDDVYWYWHGPAERPGEGRFSPDMTRGIRGAGSVTGSAIQIAYHLGFDPIYLIGVDASYQVLPTVVQSGPDKFRDGIGLRLESTRDDDPNHFDPRYFGKGRKWHNPNVPRMIQGYQNCRQGMDARNRRIYNATVGGQLEVFERVEFNSLF